MRSQLERVAAVGIACVALFAGSAFGMSQFDRAQAAPSSAEVRQLKQLTAEVADSNAFLKEIEFNTDKTCGIAQGHASETCY